MEGILLLILMLLIIIFWAICSFHWLIRSCIRTTIMNEPEIPVVEGVIIENINENSIPVVEIVIDENQ